MSQFYGESQWPSAGQNNNNSSNWEHQTPPPARSGASSTVPRGEEAQAFTNQIEEVDRAIDNLLKSGKMFGPQGSRRESFQGGGSRNHSKNFEGRGSSGPGSHRNSLNDFGEARGPHSGGNLQNFYAAQRHQSSRGSNEAEQMMQAKRRMAAQRERELRNYHQEQQYNRTVISDLSYSSGQSSASKPDRALSPGNMSDQDRRELIARQRSALYGEGPFGENGGYVDETGAVRPGAPAPGTTLRGASPLAYEYGRPRPGQVDSTGAAQAPSGPGGSELARATSNPSPVSNPPNSKGIFDNTQSSRTSNSSPGGSPPRQGVPSDKPAQTGSAVAPIGTRPSANAQAPNPALAKRSTTPLPSPLSHGFTAGGGNGDEGTGSQSASTSGAPSNPSSAAPDGSFGGWGGNRSGVWGGKSNLGVQASVWG